MRQARVLDLGQRETQIAFYVLLTMEIIWCNICTEMERKYRSKRKSKGYERKWPFQQPSGRKEVEVSQQGNKISSSWEVLFVHLFVSLSFRSFLQALLNSDVGISRTVGSHLSFAVATTEVPVNWNLAKLGKGIRSWAFTVVSSQLYSQ